MGVYDKDDAPYGIGGWIAVVFGFEAGGDGDACTSSPLPQLSGTGFFGGRGSKRAFRRDCASRCLKVTVFF